MLTSLLPGDDFALPPTGYFKPSIEQVKKAYAAGLYAEAGGDDTPEMIAGDMVFNWRAIEHVLGKAPAYRWQFTGCCVESGSYNAMVMTEGLELVYQNEPEQFEPPLSLAMYGQGRAMYFHDESQGEGSSAIAQAAAGAQYGWPSALDPLAPKQVICGPAVCYDRGTELQWSSVRSQPHDPAFWERAKRHVAQHIQVRSADEAISQFRRGRVCLFAGDWGGVMNPSLGGSPEVLLMPRAGVWNHLQCGCGYWKHPQLGDLFCILNNWYQPGPGLVLEYGGPSRARYVIRVVTPGEALPVHGINPVGPIGSYWIRRSDFEYQCRTGEVLFLKGFKGYQGGVDWMRV